MANSPQSLKRARQAENRRRRNQGVGSKFRTMVKRARTAGGNTDTAQGIFADMQSATDIAARKGIIHPRKAARLKKRVNRVMRKNAAAVKSSADSADSAAAEAPGKE